MRDGALGLQRDSYASGAKEREERGYGGENLAEDRSHDASPVGYAQSAWSRAV